MPRIAVAVGVVVAVHGGDTEETCCQMERQIQGHFYKQSIE